MKKSWNIGLTPRIQQFLKTGICLFCLGMGVFFVFFGWRTAQKQTLSHTEEAEIEVTVQKVSEVPESQISWEDFCLRYPDVCNENTYSDDFLYKEEDISVEKNEEANLELFQQIISESTQDSATDEKTETETETETKNQSHPSPLPEENEAAVAIFDKADDLNEEALDKLYEEPLSENIIEEDEPETDTEFTHIYNKDIKDFHILPTHKPPYFGEFPVIAVVIDDMGISPKRTKDIADLTAPLTVSFLTYGKNLEKQIENSRKTGQEIMIHIPMEAQKNVDVAPDVLTTQMSLAEIKTNLRIMLDKFNNVYGVNNHMGSKLTEDKMRMLAVMEVLKERGLFFLDSKTSAKSRAEEAAAESGLAYAHRHIFIDNNNDKEYILKQLSKAENVARKNGYAIAIGHPKTQTYAALKEWIDTLTEKKIQLMHLSKIINILDASREKQF